MKLECVRDRLFTCVSKYGDRGSITFLFHNSQNAITQSAATMSLKFAICLALCLWIFLSSGAGESRVDLVPLSFRDSKRQRKRQMKQTTKEAARKAVDDWSRYRLADVIKGFEPPVANRSGPRENVLERWPDSIAAEYLRQTEAKDDFDVLCEIVRQRSERHVEGSQEVLREEIRRLPNTTAVLHLRLGDVCDWKHRARQWWFGSAEAGSEEGESVCGVFVSLSSLSLPHLHHTHTPPLPKTQHAGLGRIRPWIWYKNTIIPELKQRKVTSIVVVGSTIHDRPNSGRGDRKRACEEYRSHLVRALRKEGFGVMDRVLSRKDVSLFYSCGGCMSANNAHNKFSLSLFHSLCTSSRAFPTTISSSSPSPLRSCREEVASRGGRRSAAEGLAEPLLDWMKVSLCVCV